MAGALNLDLVSTRQQRIAELAKQSPQMGFTSLNHHIDRAWLYEAFLRTRRDGAPGVDGQTAADYEADLQANLQTLLDRAKSGTYRAPAFSTPETNSKTKKPNSRNQSGRAKLLPHSKIGQNRTQRKTNGTGGPPVVE